VEFADIEQLGRNPAQIIPAWQQFLNTRSGRLRPVRGVGEPIWPGRRPEELVECQLHEAMLNIAIDPDTPFWLICSYDAVTLSPAVVGEAHRSHPVIVEAASYQGSALELYIAGLPAGAAGDLAATTPTSGAEQSSARSSRRHSPDVEPAPRSDL
jgi:MEDS: MEthanogen/methylotroph, DcmR Sensory domain